MAIVATCIHTFKAGSRDEGETLAETGDEARVFFSDVEPARVAEARSRFPFLTERRPQAYRR